MKKAWLLVVLVLILFAKTAYADDLSFGSVGHNKRVTMIPGQIKEFKLSFFNYGNQPIVVEVKRGGSDEIRGIITPKNFGLENRKNVRNPMEEEEWVVLGENYVKAVPVKVILKVPDNISELTKNYHIVKIVAKASSEETGVGGTLEKISQVHEYTYAITVPGNVNAETFEEYNESLEEFYQELKSNRSAEEGGGSFWNIGTRDSEGEKQENQRGQLPTGFFSLGGEEEDSSSLYLIILVVIIIAAYFIYRRLRR